MQATSYKSKQLSQLFLMTLKKMSGFWKQRSLITSIETDLTLLERGFYMSFSQNVSIARNRYEFVFFIFFKIEAKTIRNLPTSCFLQRWHN